MPCEVADGSGTSLCKLAIHGQPYGGRVMGLSWQQGALSPGAIGRFLVPESLPKRLLYAERLRRRIRVRFAGTWIADSENVIVLFEPGRYPVAYFPESEIAQNALHRTGHTTSHSDLGLTSRYTVQVGGRSVPRAAWQHVDLPHYASELRARVAFAWRAMDEFYDVLYESGFVPRWYVARADIDESALTPIDHQTFCPYKGLCNYYDIADAHQAAWSYREAYREVSRISDLVSFEPDVVSVQLDGIPLRLESGQAVIPHGPDRDLSVSELRK